MNQIYDDGEGFGDPDGCTDSKGGADMLKEYRSIAEVAGPLMLVRGVEV